MTRDDLYTINLPEPLKGDFIVGDMIDMLTGDIIAGPYCEWPKRKRRQFVVTKITETRSYSPS